jgi:hypothetical protein
MYQVLPAWKVIRARGGRFYSGYHIDITERYKA